VADEVERERRRKYHLDRYHSRRREAIEKLGGKCVECDSVEQLEFDHIDPSTKEFCIGTLWGVARDRFDKEIEKCQLLCKPCHTEKTFVNRDGGKGFVEHGTYSGYRWLKCRCEPCRNAEYKQRKNWKRS
jgi:5-methylcytosine-specific restriction endonuclease McrA